MSRVCTVLGVLALTLLFAASAMAQPGGGRRQGQAGPGMGGPGGPGMGGPLQLLRLEQVQKEIELVDDQKTKLRELGEESAREMREAFSGMRDLNEEQRRERMEELRKKAQEREAELAKKIEAILLPHQLKRLKEISVQVQGIRALNSAEVAKELGITEDQKAKMESIRREVTDQFAKLREEMQDLSPEQRRERFREMGEKMRETQQQVEEKILNVLTAEQKEKFEALKGKKFDVDMRQMMGGFGGNRRGGEGAAPGERRRPGGGEQN